MLVTFKNTEDVKKFIVAFLYGFSLPLSFLNYYGFALQGILLAIVMLFFMRIHNPRKFKDWVSWGAVGSIAGITLLLFLFGPREMGAILANISTMRYEGQFINNWPVFLKGIDTAPDTPALPMIVLIAKIYFMQFMIIIFLIYSCQKLGFKKL